MMNTAFQQLFLTSEEIIKLSSFSLSTILAKETIEIAIGTGREIEIAEHVNENGNAIVKEKEKENAKGRENGNVKGRETDLILLIVLMMIMLVTDTTETIKE